MNCFSTFNGNDDQRQTVLLSLGKSFGWIVAGGATASLLPVTTPSAASLLILSYLASRAAQPIVNTKLAVQRYSNPQQNNSFLKFFRNEALMFKELFLTIGLGNNSHSGGNMYALRGAFAKMLTFAGFDAVYSLISPVLLSYSLPTFVIIPLAGLLSGFLQGTLVSLPEYLSTLQSRFHQKSNQELFNIIRDRLILTYGLPIWTVSLRNGLFDMVFNSLRVGYDLPFGPSAVVAMTFNYPVERIRSLVHQHEIPRNLADQSSTNQNVTLSQNNQFIPTGFGGYQGWLSKSIEFFMIYQLLQCFKDMM